MNRPALLSTLWIVLFANYVYCDVLGFYDPTHLAEIMDGGLANIDFGPGFQVAAGALMQIPIMSILLSRVLPRAANRATNVVAASVMILVQFGSLFLASDNAPVYIFFSVIEVALLIVVIVSAVTWKTAPVAASTLQPSTV